MKTIRFNDSNPLNKVKLLVIYLGNTCNFDCVYCDRGYIESVGGQNLTRSNSEGIREFFEWATAQPNVIKQVSFHGGEPLLFIKRIYEIMEWLYPMAVDNGWIISMTTNGSLIKECEDFFIKYNKILNITVSYDFSYQEKNREKLYVDEMAEVLNKNCNQWQWQYVVPIDDPSAFSFDSIKEIVNTCYRTKCSLINLIPLRHKRGKDKFDVIIDDINLPQFLDSFMQFIQILYIKKIKVFIDGCYSTIDKAYFSEHTKLVLSPDGYIYPEFDFLEYKLENMRVGDWRLKQIWKNLGDADKILNSCLDCDKLSSCGLKYLYPIFGKSPKACKEFYTYLDLLIMHNAKMHDKKSMLHWVGIKEDFAVNT